MAVLLVLVTIVLYWPATHHEFINFDDQIYVFENAHVASGLTMPNVRWAFWNEYHANWHPVTWLSHMLDCQLFGLNPWGHHLTSLLLHAINAALVFALLQQMTGTVWRSLFVAALFAVHPLRVESVAWVAERKDVLSGFFGLLSLIYYARYARTSENTRRKPETGCVPPFFFLRFSSYWLALLFFALGLMSKPMLVTWPFVMLLLDCWPLRRFEIPASNHRIPIAWRLFSEKIPFFALAVVASVVTFMMQRQAGAMRTGEQVSPGMRGTNALISYCGYLEKSLWPTNLAVYYPLPGHWPGEEVLLAGALIIGISVLLFVKRRKFPYLLMGWLWFVGTLVPVIGLVQVGGQAMADRYSYIPSLGLLILTVWGVCELTRRWRHRALALSVAGLMAVVLCFTLTRQQLGWWQDSETLFRHALAVTGDNNIALEHLGDALLKKGEIAEAIGPLKKSVQLEPGVLEAHNSLGIALGRNGQTADAINQFREAIHLNPDDADAHNYLGNALDAKGLTDEAISQYQIVIRFRPDYADTHYNLGSDFFKNGKIDEATSQFREAIRLNPDDAKAHYNLGIALNEKGQADEAIKQFKEVIRLKPDDAEARNNLGTTYSRNGQLDEAISQFEEAIRLNPDFATAQHNLNLTLEMKNNSKGRKSDLVKP